MDNINNYLTSLGITEPNEFIVEEVVERALNYMRRDELPVELERVIARAIYNAHRKFDAESDGIDNISSLTDGSQSVSYGEAKSFMPTLDDNEIFGGYISQLRLFRKVGVINEDTE